MELLFNFFKKKKNLMERKNQIFQNAFIYLFKEDEKG